MALPESVLRIVRKAAEDHPGDIERAVSQAVQEVRKLKDYQNFVDNLVRHCIKEQVHEARHKANVRIKHNAKHYQRTYRTSPSSGAAVEGVYRSVYEFRIAGTTLGELRGSDLRGIAENERALAGGHQFRARLCEWLIERKVPDDKKVREVVSEKELVKVFKGLQDQFGKTG